MNDDDINRTGLAIGLLVGIPLMVVGVLGLAHHTDATPPSSFFRFFIGGNILHDAVVAPIVGIAGWILINHAPRVAVGAIARRPVRDAHRRRNRVASNPWLRAHARARQSDRATVELRHRGRNGRRSRVADRVAVVDHRDHCGAANGA